MPDHPAHDPLLLLRRLAEACLEELSATAVSFALVTGGEAWVPVYTTGPEVATLEQYALTIGEGPCFDTLSSNAPVRVPELTSAEIRARWPMWSQAATAAGFGSAASFPVQAGAIVAGVMTAYAPAARSLSPEEFRAGLRLAEAALVGLLDIASSLARPQEAGAGIDDLEVLLRGDVHRAAGMAMVQANVSIETALARLRAFAFSSGRALTDVAADVVERRLRFEPESDSAE